MELKEKLQLLADLKKSVSSTACRYADEDSRGILRINALRCIPSFHIDNAKYLREYYPDEYEKLIGEIYGIQDRVLELQKKHISILDEHLDAINKLLIADPKCSLPE